MKVAIYEINLSDKNYLKQTISRYFDEISIPYELYFFDDINTLLKKFNQINFNVFILNVTSEKSVGILAAKQIRKYSNFPIIFTADNADYAIKAFDLNAIHYLIKPIHYQSIINALSRCRSFFEEESSYLDVKIGHKCVLLPQKDINYIEMWNKIATVYMENKQMKTYSTLDMLYSKLEHTLFIRPQRSYIVNMNYIESIEKDKILLKNGIDITLSRIERANIKLKYQGFITYQK